MAGSKVLKPVAGVVILVGLYAAAGYIGVPAGVRWAVSNVVPDALGGRDATVGVVSFNPWNWSLEINDLAIKSAPSSQNNLLTLKHLSADLSTVTLNEKAPTPEPIPSAPIVSTLMLHYSVRYTLSPPTTPVSRSLLTTASQTVTTPV